MPCLPGPNPRTSPSMVVGPSSDDWTSRTTPLTPEVPVIWAMALQVMMMVVFEVVIGVEIINNKIILL